MAEGTFKIPLGTYYETSRNVKSKVTELANDVENNFLNQVSRHIGELDDRDIGIVESFSAYTTAKTELVSLRQCETVLNNMSMEGGSNPLNGVVSTDNAYASTFSGLSTGTDRSKVTEVVGQLSNQIAHEKEVREVIAWIQKYGKAIGDNDYVKRLLMLAKTNPSKALEKLLGNEKFLATIAKNGKIDRFFWGLMNKINDSEKLPKSLMNALIDNDFFVKWADKLSLKGQDKVLNIMAKIYDKGYKLLNKGGKFVEWATKLAECKPVKLLSKLANTGLGKVITSPWFLVGAKGVVSSVSSYFDKNDKAYGDVGKSAVGGTIDAIASIGPLDGALMGASVGGPIGAAIGFGIGAGLQLGQFLFPNAKDWLKDKAYKGIDKLRGVGKAVASSIRNVTTSASQSITQGVGKFAKSVSGIGKSAQGFLSHLKAPSLRWFG